MMRIDFTGNLSPRSLLGVAAAALLVTIGASCGAGDVTSPGSDTLNLDSVGETADLVEGALWPVRWEGSTRVVFRTPSGFATARLDGSVRHRRDPNDDPSTTAKGHRVPRDARYGRWEAWQGGEYLVVPEADERCVYPLALSPDGRFVACVHVVTDRGNETSSAYGAVIRIRE